MIVESLRTVESLDGYNTRTVEDKLERGWLAPLCVIMRSAVDSIVENKVTIAGGLALVGLAALALSSAPVAVPALVGAAALVVAPAEDGPGA